MTGYLAGYYGAMMKATTGQILGKAHKLCAWLREADLSVNLGTSAIPLAWAIDGSQKWHVGDTNEYAGIDRETIDSIPIRLPVKQMFIESTVPMRMADERVETASTFAMCYDNGDETVDGIFFYSVGGEFRYVGGAQLIKKDGNRKMIPFLKSGRSLLPSELDGVSRQMLVVERVLLALACTNVRSVDNAPPAALNKKRQKAGKFPLFTYKTLHVLAGERSGPHSQREDDDDARRSPRLHFRRGHVRRIGDGRITWVQQCMVGNRRLGVVEKAYALEAR